MPINSLTFIIISTNKFHVTKSNDDDSDGNNNNNIENIDNETPTKTSYWCVVCGKQGNEIMTAMATVRRLL